MARTRMDMEFDEYVKVVQKDVNNYIIVDEHGKVKRKGSYVKKLSLLDNDLPIVNRAIVEYFVNGVSPETTVVASNKMIDFQKVTKVGSKYSHAMWNDIKFSEKVYRVFASKDPSDGTLYKMHKSKTSYDKTAGTPDHCFIENGDITEMEIPSKLDKSWYVNLAKQRIKEFLGES